MKFVIGFNHHSSRRRSFNMTSLSDECPRCGLAKMWSHVTQCKAMRQENAKLVNKMVKILKATAKNDSQMNMVNVIKKDLETCLFQHDRQIKTNQRLLG